jgi:hypothetical protein
MNDRHIIATMAQNEERLRNECAACNVLLRQSQDDCRDREKLLGTVHQALQTLHAQHELLQQENQRLRLDREGTSRKNLALRNGESEIKALRHSVHVLQGSRGCVCCPDT